jgi:hypothetical protein
LQKASWRWRPTKERARESGTAAVSNHFPPLEQSERLQRGAALVTRTPFTERERRKGSGRPRRKNGPELVLPADIAPRRGGDAPRQRRELVSRARVVARSRHIRALRSHGRQTAHKSFARRYAASFFRGCPFIPLLCLFGLTCFVFSPFLAPLCFLVQSPRRVVDTQSSPVQT